MRWFFERPKHTFKLIDKGKYTMLLRYESLLNLTYVAYTMHYSAKCNSGRIAIPWVYIKHSFDYQYTKIQPYTSRVQKCVFERYTISVPRLLTVKSQMKCRLTHMRLRTHATKYFPHWHLFNTLHTVCFIHGQSIYEINRICHILIFS